MRNIPRRLPLGLITSALLVLPLVTACSQGSSAWPMSEPAVLPARTHTATAAAAGQACAPGQIGPLDASFVSADTGFLLGVTLKDCLATNYSKVVFRKSTDSGLRWSARPAPPAPWGGATDAAGVPPADGVSAVLFANARDGWAYGPGLWATQDGGLTWHEIATRGRTVESMAATEGVVVAAFVNCDPYRCRAPETYAVETSPVSADAWRPVPGGTGQGRPALTARRAPPRSARWAFRRPARACRGW